MPDPVLPADLGRAAWEAESAWLNEFIPGSHQTPWDGLDPEVRGVYARIAGAVAVAAREQAGAKLAALREYRALVDEDGEQVILIGPCAEGIGCLFQRNYDRPTLGQLIDAAAEHEGEQGERAHAHVAEMAADWDAYAVERNAELTGTEEKS